MTGRAAGSGPLAARDGRDAAAVEGLAELATAEGAAAAGAGVAFLGAIAMGVGVGKEVERGRSVAGWDGRSLMRRVSIEAVVERSKCKQLGVVYLSPNASRKGKLR